MENNTYIDELKAAILRLHDADSLWVESAYVHEEFNGKTVWVGNVEVFELVKHKSAKICYAWSHASGRSNKDKRFVFVLKIDPVNSPSDAVKIAAANEIRTIREKLDKNVG